MNINFKVLTFCLIAMLLITSYRSATHAPNANAANYSIRVGKITPPTAGSTYTIGNLFELINTNNPGKTSIFITTKDNAGVNSCSGKEYGFDKEWAKKNALTRVTLIQDENQIKNLMKRGVLPSDSILGDLKTLISGGGKLDKSSNLKRLDYNSTDKNVATYINRYQNALTLLTHIRNNFPKITLYFKAVSPKDGKTYNLYITDPCPGTTKWDMIIQGRLNPQTNIPAYTNVLSKWKIQ